MAINLQDLKNSFPSNTPIDVLDYIFQEYFIIKKEYLLGHWRPNELSGGRFSEGVIRLFQHLSGDTVTPLGQPLDTEKALNKISNNSNLTTSFRLFVAKLLRILLDVRNRRDVAHIGGDVSPNESDSKFVLSCADWIMVELIRHNFTCSPQQAKRMIDDIVEYKLPLIAEVDGFLRIQNTALNVRQKVLIILTYLPNRASTDRQISEWVEYKNLSRFKKDILKELHDQAYIHYDAPKITILPKGILKVETEIPLTF